MIRILLKAGIVPSEGLAVDVPCRKLTSVVVRPVMGAVVGAAVGGRGVWVAKGVAVGGRVAVTNSGRVVLGVAVSTPHPARINDEMIKRKFVFECT